MLQLLQLLNRTSSYGWIAVPTSDYRYTCEEICILFAIFIIHKLHRTSHKLRRIAVKMLCTRIEILLTLCRYGFSSDEFLLFHD
ncbi:hypothetical protein D3C76_1657860 [compost metagenome]